MNAPASAAYSSVTATVISVISAVSRLDQTRLAVAPAADLLVDLGLDSLQLLEIWVSLERELGLAEGLLGTAQATTVEALTREAMALLGADPAEPPPPPPLLDARGIEALIPHRPPIRLIDEILELAPGRHGVATRLFPEGDPHFDGHFSGHPILPGVFMVEACAQLVGLVAASATTVGDDGTTPAIEYLAAIERFKFLAPVRPGDRLTVRVDIGRRAGGLLQARVATHVGGQLVGEGTLLVTASGETPKGSVQTCVLKHTKLSLDDLPSSRN